MKKPMIKVRKSEFSHEKNGSSRRRFLKVGGLAVVGSSLFLYSCSNDDDIIDPDPDPDPDPEVFDLGSGDVGILNYAYALEQLEAAFYTAVRNGDYYAGAPAEEKEIFDDLYNHEVIHREFFKAAITAAVGEGNEDMVLPDLEFDLSSVDLSNRGEVLETAMMLENTGVGAYNGAGDRIESETYLTIAGKIVSVEARHAAAIYALMNPEGGVAAEGTIENGLDLEYDPAEVIETAGPFIVTEFTATQLPEPMAGA